MQKKCEYSAVILVMVILVKLVSQGKKCHNI